MENILCNRSCKCPNLILCWVKFNRFHNILHFQQTLNNRLALIYFNATFHVDIIRPHHHTFTSPVRCLSTTPLGSISCRSGVCVSIKPTLVKQVGGVAQLETWLLWQQTLSFAGEERGVRHFEELREFSYPWD
jgi:hypothetical protein